MEDQEKTTFSLDDDEVVEEEVIERDEEYDDGDDYDDYDEEYEDEGDYDDYEGEGDEEYDDGYNDDYYDDRLNKVLDEIAELKRGMVPAQSPAVQPPVPQYIYQPSAPSAGSEVVMYNEISRLRDELAKNQNSLEMQKELSRIKEDMARDQRYAEAQYNAEIKRLQDKIEELLKNAESPQSELPSQQEAGRIEGGKSLDFEKLLHINEAILRASKEGDSRIHNDIAQLRNKLEAIPSLEELSEAVAAVKTAVGNLGADGLNNLSADIAALKDALDERGGPSGSSVVSVKNGGDISSSELLRQLYEIKNVIGNASEAAVKRTQTVLDLIGEFKKVSYDVHSQSTPFRDKLNSVYAFAKTIDASGEQDAVDLIGALNELIDELAETRLTRTVFSELVAYSAENSSAIPLSVRDAADRFFNLSERASAAAIDELGDILPNLLTELNKLESNAKEKENRDLFAYIADAIMQSPRDDAEIKSSVADFTSVTVKDVISLDRLGMPSSYTPEQSVVDESIVYKLDDLRNAVVEGLASDRTGEYFAEILDRLDSLKAGGSGEATAVDSELQASIEQLRAAVEATGGADFATALEELRNNYLDISERLVDISERINGIEPTGGETVSEGAPLDADATSADLLYIRDKLDGFDELFNRIDELREYVAAAPAAGDPEQLQAALAEVTAQFDKLYEDLSNVILEAETNLLTKLGDTPVGELVDGAKAEVVNEVRSVKDELLSEVQTIKDSILLVADGASSVTVTDTLDQLRADISALADTTANNAEVAAADRQRLLDDIAFLREQAELALEGGESEETFVEEQADDGDDADRQTLYAYLDDIAAKVTALGTVPDDTAAANTSLSAVLDLLTPVSDKLNEILDRLDAAAQQAPVADELDEEAAPQTATVTPEELAEIRDGINAILDTVPLFPQADDLVTTRDNTYSILDNLAMMPQADDIIVTRDNVSAVLDAVNEIAENIRTLSENADNSALAADLSAVRADVEAVLAALPQALAEDLAVVRDNTGAALDSLATIAQTQEDITAIGEDVAAIRHAIEAESGDRPDNIANIMQDLGIVIDKLEAYEQNAQNNKQEIIEAVSGIREEIHINELDETMTAAGIDDETRDTLVTEIADIRERLSNIENSTQALGDVNANVLDDISSQLAELRTALQTGEGAQPTDGDTEDIILPTLNALVTDVADIKAALEAGISTTSADEVLGGTATDEALQNIVDELSVIREKLNSDPVYDTVEEILSLREDVKAARIVDQDEVSGELEAIKNELAYIASGNILDEIRALRDDIAGYTPAGGEASAPTDVELNLVLNEIVSLRDEVFAFKDEVVNATATAAPVEGQPAPSDRTDDVSTILDELTALRSDQGELSAHIDELKDVISRRTTIGVSDDETEQQPSGSDELGVVLDEIINLKNDIENLGSQTGDSSRLDLITEQIEEIRAILGDAPQRAEGEGEYVAHDHSALSEQLEQINGSINELLLRRETTVDGEQVVVDDAPILARFDELKAEIEEIKTAIAIEQPQYDFATEIVELREELNAVREENARLKQESTEAINSQLAELRDAIRDMVLVAAQPATDAAGDTSYGALIEEMRALREQVAATSHAAPAALDEEALQQLRGMLENRDEQSYASELGDIRDEIAQLRSLTTVAHESEGNAEIAALREELAELKSMLASPDSLIGVAEDVTAIKEDVQTLKDEPDLGVMNEILALRDEFQALREEIADVKRIAGETDKETDENIMSEIQSLRDQLFAISMANVNDTESGETNYESYNNIILDELAALRDRIDAVPSESASDVSDELAQLRATLERREAVFNALSDRVSKLDSGNNVSNNKVLEELAQLRTELANQRDADLTTLNFMSEMAHLLERQNQYLTENADAKISDEIESLKAELASTDSVAEEVAKLREVMAQAGGSSDNETILGELAELREELSREKPSKENAIILDEIARLRDEITALAANERAGGAEQDGDLSDSLTDLKNQLNEIAGIVEPEKKAEKPSTGKRKPGRPSTKSGSGKKSTSTAKSSGGSKRGRKPKSTAATSEYSVTERNIDAIIDEQASKLAGADDELGLDITAAANTPSELDIADKLAKQVANKLIMEQLVEQLGDGGVDEAHVDAILRDILPQEFTTQAMSEQNDKIRRLANRLVLNKLRDRLNGVRKDDDD